ncbi:MAG: VWA domain-containing protein [Rhizobiaceae bacterium]|nr:VWA domain-containing protein [Rhizobiaceae bacterium]
MITGSTIFCGIKNLLRDRSGNFGILTALAIPVTAAAAGVAVDVSNMALSHSQLQEASDAAALATATALADGSVTTDNAQQFATNFVIGQMSNYLSSDQTASAALKSGTTAQITPTTNSSGGTSYSVVVNATYPMSTNGMTHMLGISSMNIGSSSTSSSGTSIQKSALSMYFVLDRSGSMDEATDTVNAQTPTQTYTYSCTTTNSKGKSVKSTCTGTEPNYYTKMQSLKIAVSNLATQLNGADPNSMYVRTGAESYNSVAQTASPMAWGTSGLTAYVNNLSSSGTTNSAPAFTDAVTALTSASSTSPGLTNEQAAHKAKNGQTNPGKYIVFMTDGDNNVANADTTTKLQCDKARQNNITVYTIAFMAPSNGQALLSYCATTQADYFTPQNAADLFSAFSTIGAQASKQLTLLNK